MLRRNKILYNNQGKLRGWVKVALWILVIGLVFVVLKFLVRKIQETIVETGSGVAAGVGIPLQRKSELAQIADAVYGSMAGPGTWFMDFQDEMVKIDTDDEFVYFDTVAFGKRDGYSLREWISGEWAIDGYIKDWINDQYQAKGMKRHL